MRYKLLGRSGLRVSELGLGGMSLGESGAEEGAGERLVMAFGDAGGTYIDLANRYADGRAEEVAGRAVAGDRDRWVLGTKFSLAFRSDDPNAAGNGRKNMVRSLEGSLRRLGTEYVDLYWVHAWDFTTAVEEVMRALDDLVRSGKVLHVGVSDAPAWIVAAANTTAGFRGGTPFAALQVSYSLRERTCERELLPMARHLGLTVAAWSPLGGGLLGGKRTRGVAPTAGGMSPGRDSAGERDLRIALEVDAVADELGASSAQVALAWLRGRGAEIIPLVGTGRLEQLRDVLAGLELRLGDEHRSRLDTVSRIDLGFPHDFLAKPAVRQALYGPLEHRIDLPPEAGQPERPATPSGKSV